MFRTTYDIIFDIGTLEHCFNISQAMQSISLFCKTDGLIIHSNPMTMLNHGFYNLNPTFYYDFYTYNNYEFLTSIMGVGEGVGFVDLPQTQRFNSDAKVVCCIVRKTKDSTIVWPMQSKYKKAD
jgi:hypothetical protein